MLFSNGVQASSKEWEEIKHSSALVQLKSIVKKYHVEDFTKYLKPWNIDNSDNPYDSTTNSDKCRYHLGYALLSLLQEKPHSSVSQYNFFLQNLRMALSTEFYQQNNYENSKTRNEVLLLNFISFIFS